MTYQRPGTFPSVDDAFADLAPMCFHCRRREAVGLLDDVPACPECVELEAFGIDSRDLGEVLDTEERRGWS